MKTTLMGNIQSFSDIITNSSSELFISTSETFSTEIVWEMLKLQFKAYEVYWKHKSEYAPWYDHNDLSDILTIEVAQSDGEEEGWGHKWKKGDIIIRSVHDNSIPWEMQEFLENRLDFRRYHLG